MPRPLVGICAAVEPASFGPWTNEPAVILPLTYADSVQRAGAMAALLAPDPQTAKDPDELLDRLDALILGGGADLDAASYGSDPHAETTGTNPARDQFEIALAGRALERDMPVLGVCRGMQVLNVAGGGTLEQHLPDLLGRESHRPVPGSWAEHGIRLEPGSLAARAAGAEHLTVKSHHHQGIAKPGKGVAVTGWAEDEETIEAIEFPASSFALGVLWHPEEDPEDSVIPSLLEGAD